MNPSLSAPPAPRPPSIRQALLATFGAVEPTLFVHPRQYSDAFLTWLQQPSEQSLLKWHAPQRAAYRQEAFALEEVFHTSAFLRYGDNLTRFQHRKGPEISGPLSQEFLLDFQDFQSAHHFQRAHRRTSQAYQAALSPNQQLRSLLDSDASDFGYQP